METKMYLVKMLTNTAGADAPSINVYDTLEECQVAYHNILAAYHNATDVYYAVVSIMSGEGRVIINEIVDHRPEDEKPEVEGE